MTENHRYTEEERRFFEEYVPGHSHREIHQEFCRRFGSITLGRVRSYINNHNLNTGRTGYFPKGHVPANKGKKMPAEVYAKAAPTMFRSGQQPLNTDPIGTEKMLSDGYVWIKLDDKPKVPKGENWIQKHRKIWQDANGPIPEGYLIIFLDGDHMNFDIKNLACVSRAQHARLNQNGLRQTDPELTKTGILIADLMTKAGRKIHRAKPK